MQGLGKQAFGERNHRKVDDDYCRHTPSLSKMTSLRFFLASVSIEPDQSHRSRFKKWEHHTGIGVDRLGR